MQDGEQLERGVLGEPVHHHGALPLACGDEVAVVRHVAEFSSNGVLPPKFGQNGLSMRFCGPFVRGRAERFRPLTLPEPQIAEERDDRHRPQPNNQ